jgi:putative ABC transport system permease protein
MIYSFFKLMLRNLRKNPVTSFINIFGFSSGIAIAALIFSYVYQEMNYEHYHPLADKIYKVEIHITIDGEEKTLAVSPNILGPRMKEKIPEVENYCRMLFPINSSAVLIVGNEFFKESNYYMADSTVIDLFHFEILHGEKEGLLTRPEDVMISERAAVRLFGMENAVGKTFKNAYGQDFVVRAVFRHHPESSHFKPEVIASALAGDLGRELQWDQANYYTYLLLNAQADPTNLEGKIAKIVQEEAPDWMKQMDAFFSVIPIRDIHLKSRADFQAFPSGDIREVYASIIVAVFILLIAVVNYVNLTTARSLERAREVGLRKMMGSFRFELILQFLFESLFITLISLILAVILILLVYPYFNQLVDTPVSFGYLLHLRWIVLIVTSGILMGVLAGIYPSVIITSYDPSLVLKGSFRKSKAGTLARKSLVIFQFIISTCLIIGTGVVYRQIRFMSHRDLGFDKEHALVLTMNKIPEQSVLDALKKNYLQHNNIRYVSFSSAYPTRNSGGQLLRGEGMEEDQNILAWEWRVDKDIVDAFGLKLIAGRDFSTDAENKEDKEYIINQTAMRVLGWHLEDAIGKELFISMKKGRCIGVIEDFHFASLRNEVEPQVLNLNSDFRNHMIIRLGDGNLNETMKYMEAEWKKNIPEDIFDYHFIDASFDRLFRNERKTAQMFSGFSLLAIVIASLGLFGLSTYETQIRTKEIGIRKAMGSSDLSIFGLLMGKFTALIGVAFLFSIPVSYLFMSQWLNGFAYRISMGLMEFLFAAFICFIVILFSVGYRSLRASIQNPAHALRYE